MKPVRLHPPFWRHDAYTLRRLADAVTQATQTVMAAVTHGDAKPCVVDLGAGDSPYRSLFEERGAKYVSCDIDVPEGGDIVRIESGKPVPLAEESAQVVVSFQVLEHVWDLDWYLGEARRLLASDGRMILSTHGTWLYHPHPTDFRRWTRTGLIAEIESRGFKVISTKAVIGPLAWTTQFRAFGWWYVLSKVPVIGSLLSAISNSIHNIKMAIEDKVTPQQWIDDNAAAYVLVIRHAET